MKRQETPRLGIPRNRIVMKPSNNGRRASRLRRSRVLETERLEERAMLASHSLANPVLLALTTREVSTASTTPIPTTREIARQHYSGVFQGSFLVGPGQYTDQAATIRIEASGHSNQSYNANMQMILLTPLDQVNGSTTGAASIAARNVATSGTSLILNLAAPPATSRGGLPTSGTWTVSNGSGGAYIAAGPFGNGSGTFKIRYVANGNVPQGAHHAGRVVVVLQGQVYSSGVTNPVFGPANTPRNP